MVLSAPWWQGLIVVGSALVVSSVSLLYRYRQKGNPFGSLAAARWAIAAIVVSAAPATLALLLPRVPPAYLGVAVPTLLVVRGDRLHERGKPTEDAAWYKALTLGVRLLLDGLERQLETDRDAWVEAKVGPVGRLSLPALASILGLDALEEAIENVHSKLDGRPSMKKYSSRLKSHQKAGMDAIELARTAIKAGNDHTARREAHKAREALKKMLRLAYDSGNQSAVN
jgi:hypothetical protein